MCVEDLPPRRIDFKVTRHSQDATPTNYDYNYNPIHRARTAQRSRLPSSYYKLFDSPHFRNEKKKTGRLSQLLILSLFRPPSPHR